NDNDNQPETKPPTTLTGSSEFRSWSNRSTTIIVRHDNIRDVECFTRLRSQLQERPRRSGCHFADAVTRPWNQPRDGHLPFGIGERTLVAHRGLIPTNQERVGKPQSRFPARGVVCREIRGNHQHEGWTRPNHGVAVAFHKAKFRLTGWL